jgi:iron complex transport system substrate-binding protein
MVYRTTLITAILLIFSASLLTQTRLEAPVRSDASPRRQFGRIISMASSLTETLYALGLGDRVVGVTRYCKYPPEVKNKPRIGGYYDPNFEAVVALKPDLIVMLREHEQTLPAFAKLNIQTLVVSHQTIEGIIESFRIIGRACGKGPEGERMADEYEKRLGRIREKTQSLPRPRVLFALDRTFGRGRLADIYVAGADDYFDRMIELAGGQNAYRARGVRNPVVSPEGILWLNPEVIIDLVPPEMLHEYGRKATLADWNELGRVEAVKNHRVLIFDQDYAFVPGPRFVRLVEDLAKVLHPEVKWNWKETELSQFF